MKKLILTVFAAVLCIGFANAQNHQTGHNSKSKTNTATKTTEQESRTTHTGDLKNPDAQTTAFHHTRKHNHGHHSAMTGTNKTTNTRTEVKTGNKKENKGSMEHTAGTAR